MLNTNLEAFAIFPDGTNINVQAGTARMGDKPIAFRGGSIAYNDMISFGGDSSKYQNSMLYLQNIEDTADMTKSVSDVADSTMGLGYPSYPDATVHGLGLFTFWSSDGTVAELIDYSKIA